MTEVYEHNQGDHEDPVAGPTWTVGIVGACLLVMILLGTAALYYDVQSAEHQEKLTEQQRGEIARLPDMLREQQLARLAGPVRIEQRIEAPQGALVIPIERAMELVVHEAGEPAGEHAGEQPPQEGR